MAGVVDFWKFVTREPFGPSFAGLPSGGRVSVNWFMPPLGPNSGGHINIFRFISGLERRGFDCRAVIVNDGTLTEEKTPSTILGQRINDWYGRFDGRAMYVDDDVPAAHFSIATGWQSAYSVRAYRGSPMKCYFIQDFEPWFYAVSAESSFADETYRFGFTGITAGAWLARKLSSEYRMRCHALGFSYDRELYQPTPRRDPNRLNVFCYVRPETPRRGWETAALALDELHRRRPDVGIILAGGNVDGASLPFPALVTGSLTQSELPDLYSQCDAGLVISFSNLSLLPLELMACGVPVVSNTGPNVEWLLNGEIAKLARPDPKSIGKALAEVFELSPQARLDWSARVMQFAHRTSWEREIDTLARLLKDMSTPIAPGSPRLTVAG